METHVEIAARRGAIPSAVERISPATLVMSHTWSAWYPWRNFCRADHSARVAGAHMAYVGRDPNHVGERLVSGSISWEPMAVPLGEAFQRGPDCVNVTCDIIMEPSVRRFARDATNLAYRIRAN